MTDGRPSRRPTTGPEAPGAVDGMLCFYSGRMRKPFTG
jgi:hypothetical protein